MRIAFYAPMKPPDHPIPSGDRAMARGLLAALAAGGHDARVVSALVTRSKEPDALAFASRHAAAAAEAERLRADWQHPGAWRPDLWFTYHLYYKAPDWLGPALSRSLAIPYVTAEASYAGKRDRDAWAPWQAIVADAIRHARLNICFTSQDREGVETVDGRQGNLAHLPPFIALHPEQPTARHRDGSAVRLVTVAMMRADVKRDSYRFLARALETLADLDWHLTIVGDGPARPEVAADMQTLGPDRVTFAGALDPAGVAAALAAGDVFVWPGIGEAFGVAYLEAQAAGLPVVALRTGGVPEVVVDGRTGLLTPEGDRAGYAAAIARVMHDPARRASMAQAACRFIRDERSLAPTARRLDALLQEALR
jgi:glycosyltransferase involved in cell wall biosynthesis